MAAAAVGRLKLLQPIDNVAVVVGRVSAIVITNSTTHSLQSLLLLITAVVPGTIRAATASAAAAAVAQWR